MVIVNYASSKHLHSFQRIHFDYIHYTPKTHIYLKPQEFHLSRPKTLVGTLLHEVQFKYKIYSVCTFLQTTKSRSYGIMY